MAPDERRGEMVCLGCALVVEDRMIDGAPITQSGDTYLGPGGHGHGPALGVQNPVTMTTTPVALSRDASGRALPQQTTSKFQYLTTIDSRIVSKRDRSSKRLYEAVHDLAARVGATREMEDRAFFVARRTLAARALRGWEFSLVAGGAMYFVVHEGRGWVNMAEFAPAVAASNPETRERSLRSAFKDIQRAMGVRLPQPTAAVIARDVAARLGLPPEALESAARDLAARVPSANPRIDAASALYGAARRLGLGTAQREVAAACGTTDVSLRSRQPQASNTHEGMS